jgi:ABC-type sugar transport system substrate-binding protein
MSKKKLVSMLAAVAIGVTSIVGFTGCSSTGSNSSGVKIAMLPKFKGENYFDACKIGAQEAVDEINKDSKVVEFLYDGPPQDQYNVPYKVDTTRRRDCLKC